jgi:hypothetical protein
MASLFTRTILRFWTSMEPSRWNSLMTFETTSRAEAIMFASSWCVRRTLRIKDSSRAVLFPEMLGEVQQQGRKMRRDLPVQEALDDLVGLFRRSEKEAKSFTAYSGLRFMTSASVLF